MKFNPRVIAIWLSIASLTLVWLSGCAMAPAGPSTALRQQFETIRQQQRQQAEQLQTVQDQLAQLQQTLTGGTGAATLTEQNHPAPSDAGDTTNPTYATSEISNLADSASTYLAAFSNLAAGRFASAEAGFDLFLREYPTHQYSANARYWLANAQAAQNNLQAAMANLRQIVVAENGQAKAPAALALLAQIYRRQGLDSAADDVIEQLRNRYPDSPEAQHFYQSDESR